MPRDLDDTLFEEVSPSSRSPISYFGGKSILWGLAKHLFPSNMKEMASPFIGGGGLELKVSASQVRVHASDNLEPLVNFWQHFLDNPSRLVKRSSEIYPLTKEELKAMYPPDHKTWSESGYMKIENDFEKAANFWVINKQSFSGKTLQSYGYSKVKLTGRFCDTSKWLSWYNPYISVECLDWKDAIEQHRDKLLYLDPPYVELEQYYGLQGPVVRFPHQELSAWLKVHKEPWMLSYGDHPLIHELYKDYRIIQPKWTYATNNKKSGELLILKDIDVPANVDKCINAEPPKIDDMNTTTEQLSLFEV